MGQALTKETADLLLKHSKAILDSFRSSDIAVDAHTTDFFNQLGLLATDDPIRVTITEVFAGCIQYEQTLNTVISGFYNVEGRTVLRSEQNLYRVLAYIIIFRLEEFGMENFKMLVRTLERKKIFRFLNFFLDRKNLYTWMADEWSKLYDRTFVENEIIGPLEEFLPALDSITQKLKSQVEHGQKHKKETLPVTDVKPFNLTQPQPRAVPFPEEIPQLPATRPVPNTLYEEPEEMKRLEAVRQQNRTLAEQRLMEATKKQPSCAVAGKSEKTMQRMKQIELEREAELDFDAPKAHALPPQTKDAPPVKLNTAAILREWARYREAENHELKKLRALESGAFDMSAFESWRNAQMEADLASQLAEVERRKLEGKISYEEAILARQRLAEENKALVEQQKAEAAERGILVSQLRAEEEALLRKRMAEILASHENARAAVKGLHKNRAAAAAALQEEKSALLAQAYQEAAEELRRKMELIAQIRALEAQQVPKERLVDLTETPGYGFLSEMSIVELRERLCLLKQKERLEEEERRDKILDEKQSQDSLLLHRLDQISKHRVEKTRAAAARLEQKKISRERPAAKVASNPKIMDLQEKFSQKREQRQAIKSAEMKNHVNTAMMKKLSKDKREREAARWSQLEATRERVARLRTSGVVTGDPSAADNRILHNVCS